MIVLSDEQIEIFKSEIEPILNYLILLVKNKKPSLTVEVYELTPILMEIILKRSGHLMWNYGLIVILDLCTLEMRGAQCH